LKYISSSSSMSSSILQHATCSTTVGTRRLCPHHHQLGCMAAPTLCTSTHTTPSLVTTACASGLNLSTISFCNTALHCTAVSLACVAQRSMTATAAPQGTCPFKDFPGVSTFSCCHLAPCAVVVLLTHSFTDLRPAQVTGPPQAALPTHNEAQGCVHDQ
jgi:hypothetical protein